MWASTAENVMTYGVQYLVETSGFGVRDLVFTILRNALFSGRATPRPLTKINAISRHISLWFLKRWPIEFVIAFHLRRVGHAVVLYQELRTGHSTQSSQYSNM